MNFLTFLSSRLISFKDDFLFSFGNRDVPENENVVQNEQEMCTKWIQIWIRTGGMLLVLESLSERFAGNSIKVRAVRQALDSAGFNEKTCKQEVFPRMQS